MKKTLSVATVLVLLLSFTSCKSNMRRDVKRLTHKTEQCFSMVDINEIDSSSNDDFNECYEELQELMDQYDAKYKNEEESAKFSELFMEEIRKSKLSQDIKDTFEEIYNLGTSIQVAQ